MDNYGCSFVAKLSWKKIFFENIFLFFTKYTLFAEQNVFIWKKSLILKFLFAEKNFFIQRKYKWKCKKIYVISEKSFYTENVIFTQIKYKSFLNIYSFCQKNFFWS